MNHLCGYVNRPDIYESLAESLPYGVFGAAAPHLRDIGKGKDYFAFNAEKETTGTVRPPHKQTIGDCVSHGTGGAIDDLRYIRIAWRNLPESFEESATEAIYGGGRIEIGKGRLGRDDGCVVGWAIKFVMDYGVLPRRKYDTIDLTKYDGQLAKRWGASGVPDELEPIAKQFPVKTASLITENYYENARDALASGGMIVTGSNTGFEGSRDSQGFIRPRGTWAHCTYYRAFTDNSKRPGIGYQQSWGPNMPAGPKRVTLPSGYELDMPEGFFFVDADAFNKMHRGQEIWAIYDMVGIPGKGWEVKFV